METILKVDNVVVEYPSKGFRKEPFKALHGVSIEIEKNQTL